MMDDFRLSATTDVLSELLTDLKYARIKLIKHKKTDSILQNAPYGITAVIMISGTSSVTSIAAPPVGITFGIIS